MATAPHLIGAPPFTWAHLEGMPDDGYRREIIGGSLIVTPSPVGRHQLAVYRLIVLLGAAAPPDRLVIPAPFDWHLPDQGSVEPDVMVLDRADFDLDGPLPSTAVPLLVVEVLSPSNAATDRLLKRDLYERLGVPGYWIVDPNLPAVTALRLTDGRFAVEAEVAGDDSFETDWPFPVHFRPGDLLR